MAHGIRKKIAAACLALAVFIFPLASCAREPVQQGVVLLPDPAPVYSQAEREELTDAVFALLCSAARAAGGGQDLPQAALENLAGYAARAAEDIAGLALPASSFSALAALFAAQAGEGGLSFTAAAALYGKIASAVGFSDAGRVTYRLLLTYYDIEHDIYMRRYEDHPNYTYLKDEAEALMKEKAALEEHVGEARFTSAAAAACAFGTLMDNGLNTGLAQLLTDGELLFLLQEQNITSLQLSEEGWKAVLRLVYRLAEESYIGALLGCAVQSGDLCVLAGRMQQGMELLRSMQASCTEREAALLRAGDWGRAASALFARFSDEEWENFFALTRLPLTGDYDAVARKTYGAAYSAWRESAAECSAEELRAAAGTDAFMNRWEEYAAGSMPALAYAWFA